MKMWWLGPLVPCALLLLGQCATPGQQASMESAVSGKERVTSPNASTADTSDLVSGNTAFALDLYQAVREGGDNLFYSPYSISLALAMTYAGARGETERQMAETLHFSLPQDRLHPAFNGLDLALASRGEGAEGRDEGGFRLNIVNALWGQEGYAFLPEFLDLLAENYGAGLRLVDFEGDAESSRVAINRWVEDQTEGRIQDLIREGLLNELTRLVLTNAIYFNAAWSEPFEPDQTQEGVFHLADGGQVTVPMMRRVTSYGYAEGPGFQAVELPYDGRELSMVVLLPAEGRFGAFEDSLDAGHVDEILGELHPQEVALTMPRFEIESELDLADVLAAMGMPDAFSMAADFSGMDGSDWLFIKDVVHKAFVSVDEAGTEAAAATAVIMQLKGMPGQPVEVTLDRPFLFFIRDVETGAILFVGRVMDPST
jgi:serpin B